jgi:hypothetical protein
MCKIYKREYAGCKHAVVEGTTFCGNVRTNVTNRFAPAEVALAQNCKNFRREMLDRHAGECPTCEKSAKAWADRFKRVKTFLGGFREGKKGEYTPINQDWFSVDHESDHELASYELL